MFDDSTMDEKLAELDAMFDSPTSTTPASDLSPGITVDENGIEVFDILPEDEDEDENDEVVKAMQDLLLQHQDTGIHKVEDPDLKRALDEIRVLGYSNIADVFKSVPFMEYVTDTDGEVIGERQGYRLIPRDITTLPREVSACIQSIDIKQDGLSQHIKIKMYDKLVSLDKLMRFHGAYKADNEQQRGDADVMDLLLASIGSRGLPEITDNEA